MYSDEKICMQYIFCFYTMYACNIYSVFISIFNTGQEIWRGPYGASVCQSEVGY